MRGRLPDPGPLLSRIFEASALPRSRARTCGGLREASRCDSNPRFGRRTPNPTGRRGSDSTGSGPRGLHRWDVRIRGPVRSGAPSRSTIPGGAMTFRGFIAVDVPGGPVLDALAGDLEKATPSLKVVSTRQL